MRVVTTIVCGVNYGAKIRTLAPRSVIAINNNYFPIQDHGYVRGVVFKIVELTDACTLHEISLLADSARLRHSTIHELGNLMRSPEFLNKRPSLLPLISLGSVALIERSVMYPIVSYDDGLDRINLSVWHRSHLFYPGQMVLMVSEN